MEEKKKSFEQFVIEEMNKTPEQIEIEVISDPAYPRLIPSPELKERLKIRIAAYEVEKERKEAEHRKVLDRVLSEEEREALRLGMEVLKQKEVTVRTKKIGESEMTSENMNNGDDRKNIADSENKEAAKLSDNTNMSGETEDSGKTNAAESGSDTSDAEIIPIRKKNKRRKTGRSLIAAAAALAIVCTAGVGMNVMGGPEKIIRTMTGTLGGREQVYTDVDDGNTLISGENEEEKAYQKIKDELGFDPVRIVYLPSNYYFKTMELDKELQQIKLVYTNGKTNMLYSMQAHYTVNKIGNDIEDEKTNEYTLKQDGQTFVIKEYKIKDTNEKKYTVDFNWKKISYCISAKVEKEEFEYMVKYLHFV